MKKLPVAIALLASATFALGACDDGDDDNPKDLPTPVSSTMVPMPVCPSTSVSVSPSVSVSVSVSASPDKVKNDKPGDGGVAYHLSAVEVRRGELDKSRLVQPDSRMRLPERRIMVPERKAMVERKAGRSIPADPDDCQ